MKIRIPYMIQDPMTVKIEGIPPIEGFFPDNEKYFLDGPITERVAVLDFCPETGQQVSRAVLKPPSEKRVRGEYVGDKGRLLHRTSSEDLYTPAFMAVSTFGTVLKTLYLFEGTGYESLLHRPFRSEKAENTLNQTLGRPLTWAFNSPQLLIVPRAGEQANAYYHRDSHSLQFFYFPSPQNPQQTIYLCLSRDVVAHETGHAIVDGIVPDLLDACTPQSLAIHETIADLTALLMAFDSYTLRKFVLKNSQGSINDSTAFSFIAEEFGNALYGGRGLRNLYNKKTFDPDDRENRVLGNDPHALSEVLSGALYRVMIHIHEDLKAYFAETSKYKKFAYPSFSASGMSLWAAARRLKRIVFRALDYLPPGEVAFADYGRALIAVDYVAYPDDDKIRDWIRQEFVFRHIVANATELQVQTHFEQASLKQYDVSTLHSSDWAAYDFANDNLDLLCIPNAKEPIQFQVRPRLSVKKRYDHDRTGHECIFKVAWEHVEPNKIGGGYPTHRRITVGTTLVLQWDTGEVLARLTSAPPVKNDPSCGQIPLYRPSLTEYNQQREARDAFLRRLAEDGLLKMGEQALDPDGQPLLFAIQTDIIGDDMRVRGTGKMLHIIG